MKILLIDNNFIYSFDFPIFVLSIKMCDIYIVKKNIINCMFRHANRTLNSEEWKSFMEEIPNAVIISTLLVENNITDCMKDVLSTYGISLQFRISTVEAHIACMQFLKKNLKTKVKVMHSLTDETSYTDIANNILFLILDVLYEINSLKYPKIEKSAFSAEAYVRECISI